ncbi:MAG: STAS-like domain-containing protein [Firmicutes bacterium]|nr:STAS-like domain-containing protein [Bacillota bacterium]MCL2228405.1 STAS-like domain-containing protein [Bacillota bacterium]
MEKIKINVAHDFTEIPGPRYKKDGKFSGEEFRDKHLIPNYDKAKANGVKIMVNLDGGYGYPVSFLEESFGGLARIYRDDNVVGMFDFVSKEEPSLIDDIRKYILDANKRV